jgi:hypothetical protein
MFEMFADSPPDKGDAAGVPALDPQAAAEFAECSGAILAKLVADAMASVPDIPDTVEGDAQLLDLITATSRIDAWSESIRSTLTALLYQRTLAEHRRFGLAAHPDGAGTAAGASHGYDDVALTRSEVAANLSLELGQSLPVADRAVTVALGLARTPVAHQALSAGRMDPPQATSLMSELDQVPDPELRQVVAAALTTDPQLPDADRVLVRELRGGRKRLWDLPPAQIRAIVRREVAEREPELAARRVRAEQAARHVRYHALRDGMGDLVLHGPAHVLTAAHCRIDAAALAARRAGSPETLDQLRHDIAAQWLSSGGCAEQGSGPQVMMNITAFGTTMLDLDDHPAVLHGPAGPQPLPAELVRQIAHDPALATWRRILLDPSTGVATDISPAYPPPPRMAEFVRARDGHRSRFPTSIAGRPELDHVVPFDRRDPSAGGRTTGANLASAGRRDHHLKTDGALSVSGDANEALTYRTSAGREFRSFPHQYADPRPVGSDGSPDSDDGDPPDGPDPPF